MWPFSVEILPWKNAQFVRDSHDVLKNCIPQYVVFWFDIEIIFSLFTNRIFGNFFGFPKDVPCIFQLHFALWTLPRRKNVIFCNSIGDPFLQFSNKRNAFKLIIYWSNIAIFSVQAVFSGFLHNFSWFEIFIVQFLGYVIAFYAVKMSFQCWFLGNQNQSLCNILALFSNYNGHWPL